MRLRRTLAGAPVRELGPIYLVMLAVVGANFVLEPSLLSSANITDLAVQVAPFVLVALAQTMVMLLAGIDLAVGALVSLASTITARTLGHGVADLGVILAIIAAVGCLGSLTGLFVAVLRVPALVVTLATSFIWEGVALKVLPQAGGNVPSGDAVYFTGALFGVPIVVVLIALVLIAWATLRRSPAGLRLYAVGNNPMAARLSGLSVIRGHMLAYGLGAGCSALAGIVLSAQTSSGDPNIGTPFTLSSVAAAIIGGISLFGGRGRVAGAVAGAIVIGMLNNLLLYAGVSSFFQYVVQGGMLLLIVGFTTWRRMRLARETTSGPAVAQATA
jgi:ribose transport system permease protein